MTSREKRYWSIYGITFDQALELLKKQKHECGICQKPLSFDSKQTHLDHDHETDEIRGILCSNCNAGLGMFQDNVEILINAAKYLTNHYLTRKGMKTKYKPTKRYRK